MSEWISVKDRLPESDNDTLLLLVKCSAEEKPNGALFIDTDSFYVDDGYFRFWGVQKNHTVTHWMPLPEPPHDTE